MERFNYLNNGAYGPSRWPSMCKECEGKQQSPICIYTKNLQQEVSYLKHLGIAKLPKCIYIKNIDNSIRLEFKWHRTNIQPPSVSGVPLPNGDSFIFAQIHFHWNDSDDNGSEHSINGVFYAMELQMTFFNNKYATLENAKKHFDGVAIFAFFIQSSAEMTSKPWIQKALKNMRETKKKALIKSTDDDLFSLLDLIKTINYNFYSYKGGLTTPPCSECAIWILAEDRIKFHPDDINEFRKMRNKDNQLIRNCRPLQPVGCRKVFYFVPGDTLS